MIIILIDSSDRVFRRAIFGDALRMAYKTIFSPAAGETDSHGDRALACHLVRRLAIDAY